MFAAVAAVFVGFVVNVIEAVSVKSEYFINVIIRSFAPLQ